MVDIARIGIQLTEECNIACKHCCTNSSPKTKNSFTIEDLIKVIDSVKDYREDAMICFTGGEVTTRLDLLMEGVNRCREIGLAYSITTNATWAQVEVGLENFLETFSDCHVLGISYDRFHAPFIEPSVPLKVLRSATEKGMFALLRYTICADEDESEILKGLGLYGSELAENVRFSGLMAIGRASNLLNDLMPVHDLDEPCLTASVKTVRPDGNVYGCCGEAFYLPDPNPLLLGNAYTTPISEIFARSSKNIVLQAIRTIGPRKIVRDANLVTEKVGEEEVLARSPCGSCRLMFRNKESSSKSISYAESRSPRVRALRALFYGEL
ncbi:MAG: radical SAM protein [Rhodobacteraceae bacterium]|nr:radical SAM protein [Paracoccaceae bacterium]